MSSLHIFWYVPVRERSVSPVHSLQLVFTPVVCMKTLMTLHLSVEEPLNIMQLFWVCFIGPVMSIDVHANPAINMRHDHVSVTGMYHMTSREVG